ncbi:Serrate RNA effector molecule homolog [Seminavis robusta]|uniref:Serrate RNA effector molecule homolog n=1 Tax=Seminavis robusta TaxID=568900 RepID=A0A9N8HN69_9STRA|nr:Serrate RNA effector molecule homolog [Seminavis robusta]|eukprot:Sro1059_g236470.1 Serrate RNA effector molecule homolog (818) ;mRNA; r:5737-8190
MSTTVDEFGRVIPANAPLSSSRERGAPRRERSQSPPARYNSGGRGRGRSRSNKYHRSSSDRDHDRHHHRRDSREDRREWRKRPRSPSSGPSQHSDHGSSSTSRASSRHRHPSFRYVQEHMVCEYVWKTKNKDKDDNNNNKKGEEDNDNNSNSNNNNNTTEEGKESYDEYRKRYCLNYVRSFFNTHMDDAWFRNRYSPLGRKRAVQAERGRAKQEAQVFCSQVESSVQEETAEERCSFVKNARLGGGVKKLNSEPPMPKSHNISLANPENILHITDIPPHVTDEQLTLALMDHCMIPADDQAQGSPVDASEGGFKLVSASVSADKNPKQPLWRDAYFICSATVKQDIVTHLAKAEADQDSNPTEKNSESNNNNNNTTTKSEEAAVVVPRKRDDKDDKARSTLPLDVECSDPYGRLEVDADGKGGAPDDGIAVPPRKSTVWVHSQYKAPPVLVLSAAVSSKERFGRDKEAAIMMARALDVAKDIPSEHRLDEVLDRLFGENRNAEDDPTLAEDTLDVTIAYLRRVHLFSFYNGCTFAANLADVLSGRHPAGSVHLRLHNAEEILAEDTPVLNAPKDLLVSRLDDSIAKALEETNEWIQSGGGTIVNERVDEEAAELEQAEEEYLDKWLENHAIIDDDGRARCSFHFCHKLFKDKNFLRKHLQKKHKEFLRAEQAQLHDEYMMRAWDEEDQRPVPSVLVDCGAIFDLVPSAVVGAEPTAVDPEPEMWRKEEERRKREDEMQKEREERQRQRAEAEKERRNQPQQSSPPGVDERRNSNFKKPEKNFVDVDDMKEEKVEMSFDNVDVPVQPPKKKKKKKKLL